MEDSTLADKRFHILYPNEASTHEEIRQVYKDYMFHVGEIAILGHRKGFYHVNEASKLEKLLTRWLNLKEGQNVQEKRVGSELV